MSHINNSNVKGNQDSYTSQSMQVKDQKIKKLEQEKKDLEKQFHKSE